MKKIEYCIEIDHLMNSIFQMTETAQELAIKMENEGLNPDRADDVSSLFVELDNLRNNYEHLKNLREGDL